MSAVRRKRMYDKITGHVNNLKTELTVRDAALAHAKKLAAVEQLGAEVAQKKVVELTGLLNEAHAALKKYEAPETPEATA